MRRVMVTLGLTLAILVVLGSAFGCKKQASTETLDPHRSTDATVAIPAKSASDSGPNPKALLLLHIDPLDLHAGEEIRANVEYFNESTTTPAAISSRGGSFYNVRITSASGDVVYDSAKAGAKPSDDGQKELFPKASMAGTVRFSLKEPGIYKAVAYLNDVETPPLKIAVH